MEEFIQLESADKYNTHETYMFRKSAINGIIKVQNQSYCVVLVGMNKYLVKDNFEDICSKLYK